MVFVPFNVLRDAQVEDVRCGAAVDPLSETEHIWAAWSEESAPVETFK